MLDDQQGQAVQVVCQRDAAISNVSVDGDDFDPRRQSAQELLKTAGKSVLAAWRHRDKGIALRKPASHGVSVRRELQMKFG